MNFEKQLEAIKDKQELIDFVKQLEDGTKLVMVVEFPKETEKGHNLSFKSFGDPTLAEACFYMDTGKYYLHGFYDDKD